MSRHNSASSYGHHVRRIGFDWYRLGWTVDFYYPSSRLRHPRSFSRDTDEKGAERFVKRWNLPALASTKNTGEKA